MKRKRIAAAALLIALLVAISTTGCAGILYATLTGGPPRTEERGESGSVEGGLADSPELEDEPQSTGTGAPSGLPEAERAPEAALTGQPLETGEEAQPPESESPARPPTAWPQLPETPAPPPPPPVIPVESITLDAADITIDRHSEHKLAHTVSPEDATDKTVSYISSDRTVATVTNSGVVYAAGAGTAVIQCISASGDVSASCNVTVIVPVRSLSISVNRSVYKTGEEFSFTVGIQPADATDKTYTVSLDNTDAADLDGSEVTCVSSGIATITATASNGVTASREIRIVDLVELADEVFRLTNAERQNNGLADFSRNSALSAAAVTRAKESAVHFSHTRPDGRDCFTAFDESGVSYGRAAENIAYGQTTPAEVVAGWMNSPGHRANILNPNLGSLGIGAELDGNGRLYWAQAFTD